MSSLDDLRATLDAHAHDSGHPGLDPAARTGQVRGRVRRARRRRTAAAATLTAAAVAAVALVAGPGGPGGNSSAPGPAGEGDLRPPAAMTALGWTYRYADATTAADAPELTRSFEPSDRPRLITWATDGADQDVEVLVDGDPWLSDAADFEDHLVLEPELDHEVSVRAEADGVVLAVYEVDESAPAPGTSRAGLHYRERIGSRVLAGAGIGDRGQTEVAVPLEVPAGPVHVVATCDGVTGNGSDTVVWVSLGPEEEPTAFANCDGGTDVVFDPGVHVQDAGELGMELPAAATTTTARVWLSQGGWRDSTPVDPATHPRLRLSLGVYGDTVARAHPQGPSYPVSYEWRGHEFEAVDVQWATGDERLEVSLPGEGPWLVAGIASGNGYYVLSHRLLDADGERIPAMDGPDRSYYAPRDSAGVVLTLDSEVPVDRFGAVVYAVSG